LLDSLLQEKNMYDWEEDLQGEENEDEEIDLGGKNSLIFLVEATVLMHDKLEGGETLFQKAISAASETFKSKIFTSDRDLISVVCFGTSKKSPQSINFNHISEVTSIDRPKRDSILLLESLLGEDGYQRFADQFGSDGEVKLHEVLWHCQDVLSSVKGKVGSRRILLLARNHDPHRGDQSLDIKARRKAADLHASNIFLEVVPVLPPGEQFNMQTFYGDIVRLADDDWSGTVTDIHCLTETVLKKTVVKRTTSKLKFDVGGMVVGVATYNLLGRASRPAKRKLAADTNEEVKSQRTWLHPTSRTPLLPSEMVKFMAYGGKNIKMTDAEVSRIRSFGETENTLKLLGFRPLSSLMICNHVKLPQFLYPSEDIVKGSKSFLHALITKCHTRNKAAICLVKQRSTSGPSYVALVPQLEETEDGLQRKPPGFHVIYLPFIDDFRQTPNRSLTKENPREAVDAAKAVISKLKLKKFMPVENAAVQICYSMIEAHALHKESMVKPEDETLPDLDRMQRKLGERSEAFISQVYSEGYDPDQKPANKPKASRKPDAERKNDGEEIDMDAHIKSGTVPKLTVDVLKTWLRSKGIPGVSSKKKAQLVEDVLSLYK